MSNYAVTDDGSLFVSWWTGAGHAGRVLAHSPGSQLELLRQLAGELTHLSDECWRVYVEPVTTDLFAGEVDGRSDLPPLGGVILNPELPSVGGYVSASYIPVVEFATRAARTCHAIGDPQLTAAVSADVHAETAAVLSADLGDLGDLTGRGRQAALLSRVEISPVQVDAAWRQLAVDPLDGSVLLTDFDPAAAAVAAATWLRAAAGLAAEQARLADEVTVIQFADDIEAVPVQTLTTVLGMLDENDPYTVVAHLVDEARTVAAGLAPNIYQLEQSIHDARALAGRFARDELDVDAALHQVRLCVLDPLRPAPDLLEDLLTGIYACWLVWDEATSETVGLNDDDLDDDLDDDPTQEQARRLRFREALRARVTADRG